MKQNTDTPTDIPKNTANSNLKFNFSLGSKKEASTKILTSNHVVSEQDDKEEEIEPSCFQSFCGLFSS
jgi:hypothetical protein